MKSLHRLVVRGTRWFKSTACTIGRPIDIGFYSSARKQAASFKAVVHYFEMADTEAFALSIYFAL
jgi:hypothetical protein